MKLSGGRVTDNVIRIGNTVHRPLNANSEFVHKLLLELEKSDFKGAPKFLGIDEANREILEYIEGYVPSDLTHFDDDQLMAAAKLIQKFHDATQSSNLKSNDEIICHNDLSPCNAVFRENLPIAFIDFDAAQPGNRQSDLAYAVWMWCQLGDDDPKYSVKEQARRIKLMCNAYGLDKNIDFIGEIQYIIRENILKYRENVSVGKLQWEGAAVWGEQCLNWVSLNSKILKDELTS